MSESKWDKKERLYNVIQRQKEMLEDIHSSIDEVIWISAINPPFEILYINKACEIVHGYSAEEMMADVGLFHNNIHPDDREKVAECIKNTVTDGKSNCEFRILHKDSSYRILKVHSTFKHADGIFPDTISGIAADVTTLRQTENALHEKIDEIQAILGSISDAFCAVDENWNYTYVNKAFCEMYNVNAETVLNRSIWNCFPKLKDSFFYSGFINAKENNRQVHMQGLSPTTGKMLSASFYPFKGGLAMYIIDITNTIKQTETIEEQQQQLKAIANFQSHQVRGPVATILGLAQLLNAENPCDLMNKEIIEGVIETAHELERSIKQIDQRARMNNFTA